MESEMIVGGSGKCATSEETRVIGDDGNKSIDGLLGTIKQQKHRQRRNRIN
jgi:hypothetical protein